MDDLYFLLAPFDNNNEGYNCFDTDGHHISDVVKEWLLANDVKEFSIEKVTAFEAHDYCSSILCVAWIEPNGKLNTYNLLLEEYR